MKDLIQKHCPEWSSVESDRAELFRCRLVEENKIQNLTRLTEPEDFFWGHLWDVYQLSKQDWLGGLAMDVGSGCGVPGLLHALISGQNWHLVESEKKKAEFLLRASQSWSLSQVAVSAERVEKVLLNAKVDSVVVRAVGPMARIWGWIGNCSTWNNLILFKGPAWDAEWAEFRLEYPDASLEVVERIDYLSQSRGESRERKLILLRRR